MMITVTQVQDSLKWKDIVEKARLYQCCSTLEEEEEQAHHHHYMLSITVHTKFERQ
jgi:hypothetical protein